MMPVSASCLIGQSTAKSATIGSIYLEFAIDHTLKDIRLSAYYIAMDFEGLTATGDCQVGVEA